MPNNIKIGIDASNIGQGGGVTHLIEILENFDQTYFENTISIITVFSSQKVLNQLPEKKWLNKKTFNFLNAGVLKRVFFQLFKYDKEIEKNCDILFSLTGDYQGKFPIVVGMSRNMLLYERDIWNEIGKLKEIIRFWLNFKKQKKCFKNAKGIIFISEYAKEYISSVLDLQGKSQKTIHHGISPKFIGEIKDQLPIDAYDIKNPFKILYVSTVHVYKHQWQVIKAVSLIRKKGIPVELNLVGGVIFHPAGKKMHAVIEQEDPNHDFIKYHGNVSYSEIETLYIQSDSIVYASTCENMPNILIESMASGVPIASSDKQPMPEFLKDGGVYFDSKSVTSIEKALEQLIEDVDGRKSMIESNINEVKNYSWNKTSKKTFKFILEIYNKNQKND